VHPDLPTRPVPYPRYDGTQPCLQLDPETFFPVTGKDKYFNRQKTQDLCSECSFLTECRDYAISHDVEGFWAGTSRAERIEERRRLGIAAIKVTVTEAGMLRALLEEIDDGQAPARELALKLGCATDTVIRIRRRRRLEVA
jgi:hypothetical protein